MDNNTNRNLNINQNNQDVQQNTPQNTPKNTPQNFQQNTQNQQIQKSNNIQNIPNNQNNDDVEKQMQEMKNSREDNILYKNDYENKNFTYKYIFINPRDGGYIPNCCNSHDKFYGCRCFLYGLTFCIINSIYFLFGCFFYFCASCCACFYNWRCCICDIFLRPIERCCLAWFISLHTLFLLLRKIFCFPCWCFKDCRACWKDIIYDSKDYAFRSLSTYEHNWDCCYVEIFQEGQHFKESILMGKDWEDQIKLGGITLESNDSNTILEYTKIYI